jgi:glucosamine-6-phosphate deaminase
MSEPSASAAVSAGGAERSAAGHDGTPPIRVSPDRAAMGEAAAGDIAAALREVLSRKPQARVVFAAAPSQSAMLAALVRQPDVAWDRVVAFHMDEYEGLDPAHPSAFGNWLKHHLFDHLPFAEVHLIPTQGDLATIATDYAAALAAAPVDIVCLGVGVNGHIAFNDPPVADFDDPAAMKLVTLDEVCRQQQVDDACFPDLAAVPERALTLTVPRLLAADRIFAIVPGAEKREAMRAALLGPISTACPASILRTHPDCRYHLTQDSQP